MPAPTANPALKGSIAKHGDGRRETAMRINDGDIVVNGDFIFGIQVILYEWD